MKKPDFIAGGLMTLNLYKISRNYYASNLTQYQSLDEVQSWLEPKGEINLILKPSNNLEVVILTEKQNYRPGDLV